MLRQLAWDGKFWRKELSDCLEVTYKTLLLSILGLEKVLGELRQGWDGLPGGLTVLSAQKDAACGLMLCCGVLKFFMISGPGPWHFM